MVEGIQVTQDALALQDAQDAQAVEEVVVVESNNATILIYF